MTLVDQFGTAPPRSDPAGYGGPPIVVDLRDAPGLGDFEFDGDDHQVASRFSPLVGPAAWLLVGAFAALLTVSVWARVTDHAGRAQGRQGMSVVAAWAAAVNGHDWKGIETLSAPGWTWQSVGLTDLPVAYPGSALRPGFLRRSSSGFQIVATGAPTIEGDREVFLPVTITGHGPLPVVAPAGESGVILLRLEPAGTVLRVAGVVWIPDSGGNEPSSRSR